MLLSFNPFASCREKKLVAINLHLFSLFKLTQIPVCGAFDPCSLIKYASISWFFGIKHIHRLSPRCIPISRFIQIVSIRISERCSKELEERRGSEQNIKELKVV